MAKQKPRQKISKYSNLANSSSRTVKSSNSSSRRRAASKTKRGSKKPSNRLTRMVMWFRELSWRKKLIILAIPVALFLILVPLITYIVLANDIKDPERLMNRNNTGIVLYDIHDKPFYNIGRAEHRENVQLDDISKSMKEALLASEDKDFYKHGGFSLVSIGRALVTGVGGGSTLTQQLVKNTLLTDERSYLRKYQELFMAIAVEQNYTKDQILEMYLNSVFFGGNEFGVAEAAEYYFGKKPKDLNLAESALLVGLLPAPNAYSPINGDPELAVKRQKVVLERMVANGFITEEEMAGAMKQKLKYKATGDEHNLLAPHFVDMVLDELGRKYGSEQVMRSGFQVKTTLDIKSQEILNRNVEQGMVHVQAMGGSNSGAIVIDPTSGEIRALVGSVDFDNPDWGKVNMALTARQPGSTFKPVYYSGALADGVATPATILHDVKTDFGGGYTPLDADKQFRGDVTLRSAISQSLNIPSVELMRDYGIKNTINMAKNLGITTIDPDKDYGLSLAIGTAEVPLLEMTRAYGTFANKGELFDTLVIREVRDKFDKQLLNDHSKSRRGISAAGAYLISNILSDNSARAPIFGDSLTVYGHTVAVKTGTTDDNRDAWTIGYNPKYAVGVWVGNNDNRPMDSGGSDMAGPIWRGTMTELLAGKPDVQFETPDNIVKRQVCRGGGLADRAGPNTYSEYFLVGALPATTCQAEPTIITVCNLETGKVESIDEDEFRASKYSKTTKGCGDEEIKVCELKTGKETEIHLRDYDSKLYARDYDTCTPPEEAEVEACDTTTGQIVKIPESQLDGQRFVEDTDSCAVTSP